MKTVSMALTAAEKAADRSGMICGPCDVEMPDYPWGLRINLDEPSIEKLGIALPDPGAVMSLVASARVVSVTAEEVGGKKRRNIQMLITDLGLAPEAASPSAAETLYGKGE